MVLESIEFDNHL